MQVAFVTYKDESSLTEDDKELAKYLGVQNIAVFPVAWNDEGINWLKYDAIILRSTWDYFEKLELFYAWLDTLETFGCKVLNPISIVRKNLTKQYFNDLFNEGVCLPPYKYCLQNKSYRLIDVMTAKFWEKVVVKPAISCGSYNTWVVSTMPSESNEIQFRTMLGEGDVIVQQFMSEIVSTGEMSSIYFNKKFSHAILKKPKEGDFRVQTKFGGTIESYVPSKEILDQANSIINKIEGPLLYARVDGFLNKRRQFILMELELIEPVLFVKGNLTACRNFYEALIALV